MKINWFGRAYYGKNKEFKRSFYFAFSMWLEYDVYDKITRRAYFIHNGCEHKHYRWNRKRVWEEYKKCNPITNKDMEYSSPGLIMMRSKV